jgi:hypothetical protein
MIASFITYAILAISGLIGSGIAMDEIRKANHNTNRKQGTPTNLEQKPAK